MHCCCTTPCEAFVEQNPRCHPLFNPEATPGGGLSLWLPDWMHTKSLGCDADLLGTAIAYMIKEVLPGKAEDNISLVWEGVQSFYRERGTKCRLSRLTYNMVKNDPFPRLSAKAIETRDLLPAVRSLYEAWVGDPICSWIHRLLFLSCTMDEVVFGNPGFMLSVEERRAFRVVVFEYHQLLTRLAHHFHEQAKGYCNYTLKNHYLCHWGLIVGETGISPRLGFLLHGRRLYVCCEERLCSEQQRCRQFETGRQDYRQVPSGLGSFASAQRWLEEKKVRSMHALRKLQDTTSKTETQGN